MAFVRLIYSSGLGSLRKASSPRVTSRPLVAARNQARMMATDDATADSFVSNAIASDRVVVFSTTTCPYCFRVKAIFSELGVPIKAYDLDMMEDGTDIRESLLRSTKQRTVPNVFIGTKHIGGCDDVFDLIAAGELQGILEAAGIQMPQ